MLLRIACSFGGGTQATMLDEGSERPKYGRKEGRAWQIGREGAFRRNARTAVLVGAVSNRLACSSSSVGAPLFEEGLGATLPTNAPVVAWVPSNEKTMNQPTTIA
jgi:hypothetical protein